MRKVLLLGALLTLGAISFGKTEILQKDDPNQNIYSGNSKLELITEGNAVAVVSDVWLEIMPMMSKGPNGASIEFDFGELKKGEVASTEGSFYAEVKEYESKTNFKKLKFTGVATAADTMTAGQIYVGLRKGTDMKTTITSDVMVPGSTQKDATVTYTLADTKGGLVGSNDRYEGYIKSTVAVEDTAHPGEFYDNGVALVVKVNQIEGTTTK